VPSWLQRILKGSILVVAGIFAAFGAGFALSLWYRKTVFDWLTSPTNGLLSPHDGGLPVYTSLTEPFGAVLRISVYSGLIFAFPVAVLGFYFMARPHLSSKGRRTVALWVPVIVGLSLGGNSFAYWVILPAAVQFLVDFADGIAVPTIRISEYIKIVVALIFWLGVVANIPVFMFMLAKSRLVDYERLKNIHWLWPFSFSLIFAGIITPTFDVFNLALVAVPIYLLFHAGKLAAWLAIPKNGDLVIRRFMRFLIGTLRRLIVAGLYPLTLLIRTINSILLGFMDVIDGSQAQPSGGKLWLDRAHKRVLRWLEWPLRI
jgi:sec-independent protein translocase protein TatC|tara:strand:+ start:966 stop:1916 length:951 start_codon:yes stop_codon:yes gene_type:complete